MNVIGMSGLSNAVSFKRLHFPDLPDYAYHIVQGFDAAAALVNEHSIFAAVAEERFIGEKGTGAFPVNAIHHCLATAGCSPESIDLLAHGFRYDDDHLIPSGERFYERQFREVYSLEAQYAVIERHLGAAWRDKYVRVPHHLAHAASSFYLSGFERALILVIDGMGEFISTTIAEGVGDHIRILCEIPSVHSLGILYSALTIYLGFKTGTDEYKVMGLASYGDPRTYYSDFMQWVHLKADGTYAIPILFANQNLEEKETYGGTLRILEEKFGPLRLPGEPLERRHKNIAAGLQAVIEKTLLHIVSHFRSKYEYRHLCMGGGVALNCTANGMLQRSRLFDQIFVQPAAGDDGSALGAALYTLKNHNHDAHWSAMPMPYWGPEYTQTEVLTACQEDGASYIIFPSIEARNEQVSDWLAAGKIIGWFRGPMEFGPRALGNRSILANPMIHGIQDRINARIKHREAFRPFAPSVPSEIATRYFSFEDADQSLLKYMLATVYVKPKYRKQLPGTTHIDGTSRLHTVSREDNPEFWELLHAFGRRTGIPILLNTSFNQRGQPIVCSPSEALRTFHRSGLDALVMERICVEAEEVYH